MEARGGFRIATCCQGSGGADTTRSSSERLRDTRQRGGIILWLWPPRVWVTPAPEGRMSQWVGTGGDKEWTGYDLRNSDNPCGVKRRGIWRGCEAWGQKHAPWRTTGERGKSGRKTKSLKFFKYLTIRFNLFFFYSWVTFCTTPVKTKAKSILQFRHLIIQTLTVNSAGKDFLPPGETENIEFETQWNLKLCKKNK